ncbi:MAG: bifunctional hydroxymethylpyrimidine kinase/phosphomethylpyrimidine kinase [Actinomycetota bacterium]
MRTPEASMNPVPVALTVAGSDSGGGAGVQADLKTFFALGVHGATAITALTAQDTRGISAIQAVPPAFVGEQIAKVVTDVGVDAAKTGMLAGSDTVLVVADAMATFRITKLVVDPVLVSTGGTRLLAPEGIGALLNKLLPLAMVVTPNLFEAGILLDREVATIEQMRRAARDLHARGPASVLVKGGHLPGPAVDILYDGESLVELSSERIETPHTHGTGCVLSAAIAAHLARGDTVIDAVSRAKGFVTEAIRGGFPLGSGPGPVNPGWNLAVSSQDASGRALAVLRELEAMGGGSRGPRATTNASAHVGSI